MKRSSFDLTEAIVALAEQNQPFQVDVDVRFPPLSLQSSYQLYCIVQESLTNVQQHAQADRVMIKGSIISGGTILEICDNGKGFNLDCPHAGCGLRNMKERVQCLGGEFNLDSNIGEGTRQAPSCPLGFPKSHGCRSRNLVSIDSKINTIVANKEKIDAN